MNPLEVLQFVRLDQSFLKLLKYLQIKGFLANQCHFLLLVHAEL